jgi:RNA-directed DNA polymerase
VVAKRTFSYVDTQVFRALWAWIKRRHANKSVQWMKNRSFRHVGLQQWVFFAKVRDEFGLVTCLDLFSTASLPIKVMVEAA